MKRAMIGFLALLLGACGGGVMTPVAVVTGLVNGVLNGVTNSTASMVTGKVMNHVPGNGTTTGGNGNYVVAASYPTAKQVWGVPDASKTPYPDYNTYRNQMLGFFNAQRKAKGLSLVVETPGMDNIAQSHADEQNREKIMGHNGVEGRAAQGFQQVNQYTGKGAHWCGENAALNANDATNNFEAWVNSPEHEQNMLHPDVVLIGLAINNGYSSMLICG